MASDTGVRDTARTMQTFLQFLMGLSLAAAVAFAVLDEVTLDLLLAAAGAAIGLAFARMSQGVLAGTSAAGAGRLQQMLYAFVGAMALSWVVSYLDKEFLDPIELLSVAMTVLAVYLMLAIITEARRLVRP